MATSESAFALSAHGPFADKIHHFQVRQQQLDMAAAVEQSIRDQSTLVVEAGTGTGKTFAYLVPALLAGERVIISTGTKNLQDQLFHRDLPAVCEVLDIKPRRALLKGRSNYLCQHRLEQTLLSGRLPTREAAARVRSLQSWSRSTKTGDLAEHSAMMDNDPITPMVTSTSENCLGGDCPYYQECFVVKARRQALESEIVVVNHHLLLADLALKEEGFGELLPGAKAVIVDEAHQLAETASSFFGENLSSRQVLDFARDMEAAALAHARDQADLIDGLAGLKKPIQDLRLALGDDKQRAPLQAIFFKPQLQEALQQLKAQFDFVYAQLELAMGRDEELDAGLARIDLLRHRLALVLQHDNAQTIRWYETWGQGFSLNSTPLSVAESFQKQITRFKNSAWIYTSATLAVNRGFNHFTETLGLVDATTLQLDSPFNFAEQSLLFVPPGLPEPNAPQYTQLLLEQLVPLLQASRGRAFLLFTSYRALEIVAKQLPQRISYPVLVHGESKSRSRLLDEFRRLGNAVLCGTSSFWEGVDVRGEALSLVVIDRLPFAMPDDPVLKARIDAHRRRGGDPFNDVQLPRAVIALKQGAGRLIRDVSDTGVLVIADPRLLNQAYGKVFLNSLPSMPLTRQLADVQQFFKTH